MLGSKYSLSLGTYCKDIKGKKIFNHDLTSKNATKQINTIMIGNTACGSALKLISEK
jgi:hypothetical protein